MTSRMSAHTAIYLVLSAPLASAQTYSSGSDGSDGPLVFAPGTTVTFDPRASVPMYDLDGDGVYHLTTLVVPAGTTVRLRADVLGTRPLVFLVQGEVRIDGVLDLRGDPGREATTIPFPFTPGPSVAGAGGYRSGRARSPGEGPSAGSWDPIEGGRDAEGSHEPAILGDVFMVWPRGGSGGGGGLGNPGASGGAGGGAIVIASSTSIQVAGTIRATGGARPPTSPAGAGSGGAVRLVAPTVTVTGFLLVNGGSPQNADTGVVRVERFGPPHPGSSSRVPAPAIPPAGHPRLRAITLDGVPVPTEASGRPGIEDLVVTGTTGTKTLVVEGRNIPPGATVTVQVFSSNGEISRTTAVLTGTFSSSSATASVFVPSGVSHINLHASW